MIVLSGMFAADPIAVLCPTGQTTGAQADNSNAHTAPGTVPAAPHADQEAVVVDANEYTSPVVIGTAGGKVNADANTARSSAFTEAIAGWKRTPGSSYPNTTGPEGTRAALLNSNPERRQR